MNSLQKFFAHTVLQRKSVISRSREKNISQVNRLNRFQSAKTFAKPLARRIGQYNFKRVAYGFATRLCNFDKQPYVAVFVRSFIPDLNKQIMILNGVSYRNVEKEN